MKRLWILFISAFLLIIALPVQARSTPNVFVTSQLYDRGQMVWRSDSGTIYALANDGRALIFPVYTYGYLPSNPFRIAPFGKVAPLMGFGKVWANFDSVRAALGWAVIGEVGRNTPILTESNGHLYMYDQLGRIVHVNPNNTWEFVNTFPADNPNPTPSPLRQIYEFNVSPDTASKGDTITVSWRMGGVDAAIIEVYDAFPRNDILYFIYDNQPTTGSLSFTMPQQALHGVSIVANGAVYENRNGILTTTRVMNAGLSVSLKSGEANTTQTWAAFQRYEHGMMIWRGDNGSIYVFNDDKTLQIYTLNEYAYLPDAPRDTDLPSGLIRPINGFGKVWWNFDSVRSKLGWAITSEQGYTLSIKSGEPNGTAYTLPDGGRLYIRSDNTWQN